jgi:hypothetical protein
MMKMVDDKYINEEIKLLDRSFTTLFQIGRMMM